MCPPAGTVYSYRVLEAFSYVLCTLYPHICSLLVSLCSLPDHERERAWLAWAVKDLGFSPQDMFRSRSSIAVLPTVLVLVRNFSAPTRRKKQPARYSAPRLRKKKEEKEKKKNTTDMVAPTTPV
ncbi:hypothetical protein ACQKWADRAFT_294008 [Trichoderma austrokoningii]